MRSISLLVSFIFILFAILQWNDSDPLPWILVYGVVAALWLWRLWSRPPWWVTVPIFIAVLLWCVSLVPEVKQWIAMGAPSIVGSMKAESPYIESVREWGGLMMALVALMPILPINRHFIRKRS